MQNKESCQKICGTSLCLYLLYEFPQQELLLGGVYRKACRCEPLKSTPPSQPRPRFASRGPCSAPWSLSFVTSADERPRALSGIHKLIPFKYGATFHRCSEDSFLGLMDAFQTDKRKLEPGCHLSLSPAYGYASGDVGTFRVENTGAPWGQ